MTNIIYAKIINNLKIKFIMKRLSIFFAALIVSVSSIFAADEVYKTISFAADNKTRGEKIGGYSKSWQSTTDGFTVDIVNFNNNNWNNWTYIKCGSKSNPSVATITTNAAIDKAITKVVVTFDAVTAANLDSTTLTVASDNKFTENVQTIKVTAAKGECPYAVTTPTENMYYKLTYACKKGSVNGFVQISKIEYYKATADVPATAIALDQTTLELEQYKYTPLVATLTPANATTTVVWTSSNEKVATVSEKGIVSALAVGTTTITATAGELTATCTVSVKETTPITCAQAVEIAKTVSANNEIAAGGKYVIRGYVTALQNTPATDMENFGNYSVWMADTKDGDKVFEAFRVVPTDGKTIAAVGDYVEVIADITIYNGIFETAEKTGTIQVIPQYTIMVDYDKTMGSIICGEDETFEIGEFVIGSEVTLTAKADSGYKFVNWTIGTETKTENPLIITINDDMEIKATFAKDAGTDVEDINANGVEVKKIVRDGQVLIIREGKIYNMVGQVVE